MFSIENWHEVFISIRKNWLRTILSGFTVALGLFIFITLFGIGNGLRNGFMDSFIDDATNIIFLNTGTTSESYAGFQEGRNIEFENDNYKEIQKKFGDQIQYQTARIYDQVNARYLDQAGSYQVRAVHPDHQYLEKTIIDKGRYLTPTDISQRKKVAVIGRLVEKDLFNHQSALGKDINLDGIVFQIVGVFSDEGGDREERNIYIPVSTQQVLNESSRKLDQINLTYDPSYSPEQALSFGAELEKDLRKQLKISPTDDNALYVRNNAENMKTTVMFLLVIGVIVIFIGFGTLIAGIVGISNIMVYIVKERTKEIGIRKALGAKPRSIVSLILMESVFITVISGFIGVGIALLTLNGLGDSLEKFFIINPSVDMGLVIMAFLALVFSGFLAGFLPARKASKVKPVVALRNE